MRPTLTEWEECFLLIPQLSSMFETHAAQLHPSSLQPESLLSLGVPLSPGSLPVLHFPLFLRRSSLVPEAKTSRQPAGRSTRVSIKRQKRRSQCSC
jgi:hypothetical protein